MSPRAEDHEARRGREDRRARHDLDEQQRQAVIDRARRELPALTRQVDDSLRRLRRIAAG